MTRQVGSFDLHGGQRGRAGGSYKPVVAPELGCRAALESPALHQIMVEPEKITVKQI
jgi:hypothetical protein